jgi:hypothetical protein
MPDGPYADLRHSVLADEDLEVLVDRVAARTDAPWSDFRAALEVSGIDRARAVDALARITDAPGYEARVYLQAWHALRELGREPPDETAGVVRGVVIEVGLEGGLDVLAAYEDGSARYFNQSGQVIVWDAPSADPVIDAHLRDLLEAGQGVADVTGPYEDEWTEATVTGTILIQLLTYAGIHIGFGPADVLSEDELGGAVIAAAIPLMAALIDRTVGPA